MLGLASLTAVVAVVTSNAEEAPLAKSDDGFVQCYEPNDTTKTCQSIAAYRRNGAGGWDNIAIVAIDRAQTISLETATPVSVRNSAVCGYIRRDDVLKGKLRISGAEIPEDKAPPVLEKVAAAMAPTMNKEICTTYVPAAGSLIAKVTIDGVMTPVPDQRVRWISPSDGYTVGQMARGAASSQ